MPTGPTFQPRSRVRSARSARAGAARWVQGRFRSSTVCPHRRPANNRLDDHVSNQSMDVYGKTKLCPRTEQRGGAGSDAVTQGSVETAIVHEAPDHGAEKAVAGSGYADGINGKAAGAQGEIARDEKGTLRAHRERHDVGLTATDQVACRLDQRGIVGR